MSTIVGIDPGITGGIACIFHGKLVGVEAMPVHDGRADGRELDEILNHWEPDAVYLENTQPMPKNGSIASFSLGLNTGIVIGVVQSNSFRLVRVRPIDWKRKMGLVGKDKNACTRPGHRTVPRVRRPLQAGQGRRPGRGLPDRPPRGVQRSADLLRHRGRAVTVALWQACLAQFRDHGTHNEQLMATLLLQVSMVDDPMIARLFDAYASEILEATP